MADLPVVPPNFDRFYGRDENMTRLGRATERVVIVSGDSGVGKSRLLGHMVNTADPTRMIASPVTRVRHSPGALKYALLRELQDVVGQVIEEQGQAQTLAAQLKDAATRLTRERVNEVPRIVGSLALAVIRDRFGSETADLIADYFRQLGVSGEENLQSRLAAASDDDSVETLIAFLAEVQSFAKRNVVLSLDACERLGHQDLALLADVCERLPDGIQLRVGFTTSDAASQNSVNLMRQAGAGHVSLSGLDVDHIRQWMEDVGVDPSRATDVQRLTDGYPLYIGDVIKYMLDGHDVDAYEAEHQLELIVEQSWASLDLPVRVVARRISGFADPPTVDRLIDFLGTNHNVWSEFERQLVASRIFCAKVNGRYWFHELRRRYVWVHLLGDEERSEVAREATAELASEFADDMKFDVGAAIPALARQSSYYETDQAIAPTLDLDSGQLAVAAALIELGETASGLPLPGIRTRALLGYARSVFGASGDLVSAMEGLVDRGLASFGNVSGSVVEIPQWSTPVIPAILAGRAANELGRLPIPRAASMLFQAALAPRIGAFSVAVYGLGRPALPQLVATTPPKQAGPELNFAVYMGSHKPSLTVLGTFGGAPVYACVTYETDAQRDAVRPGLEELRDQLGTIPFNVTDVIALPYSAVPSRRFMNAAELVVKVQLGSMATLKVEQPIPLSNALALKAETKKYVRSATNRLEQFAFHTDEPIGYVGWVDESQSVYLEVAGGREQATVLPGEPPSVSADNPHLFTELEKKADLGPSEYVRTIRRVIDGSVVNDPVIETLVELSSAAYNFNKEGLSHEVYLDAESLESEISAALVRQREDAQKIASLLKVPIEEIRAPRCYYLVVVPMIQTSTVFRAPVYARYAWEQLPSNRVDEVRVHVEPRWDGEVTLERLEEAISKAFHIDATKMSAGGQHASDTIGAFLGYDGGHIRIRFEDEPE